jgi:hypothetical protein
MGLRIIVKEVISSSTVLVGQPGPVETDMLGWITQGDGLVIQYGAGACVVGGDEEPEPVDAVTPPYVGCEIA